MTKLKPCPFCGTDEGLYPSYHWPGTGKPYAIDCVGCGFDFTPREGMDVIEAWNKRSPTTPEALTAAEVEALKEYKILFEEAQLARDEAGFLGSVPDCIRYFADEIKHLEAALDPQPKPREVTP